MSARSILTALGHNKSENSDPSALLPRPGSCRVSSASPFMDQRHFLSADVRKCVLGPQPDDVRNGTVLVMLPLPPSLASDEPQEAIMSHLLATSC